MIPILDERTGEVCFAVPFDSSLQIGDVVSAGDVRRSCVRITGRKLERQRGVGRGSETFQVILIAYLSRPELSVITT